MNTGNFIDYKRKNVSELTCRELIEEKNLLESEINKRRYKKEKELEYIYEQKKKSLYHTFDNIISLLELDIDVNDVHKELSNGNDIYSAFRYDRHFDILVSMIENDPTLLLNLLYKFKINHMEIEMHKELGQLF